MGKKGWWQQIQSDDYPETITNYGDHRAVNWKPEQAQIRRDTEYEPRRIKKDLIEKCPVCGVLYKAGKGCYCCGYGKEGWKEKVRNKLSDEKNTKPKRTFKKPEFTSRQKHLIEKHIKFYISLDSGNRIPETPAQKRFVDVCRGKVKAKTEHEIAYTKYRKTRKHH